MARKGKYSVEELLLLGEQGAGASAPDLVLPTANLLAFFYGGNGLTKPAEINSAGDGQVINNWASRVGVLNPAQSTAANKPIYDLSDPVFNDRGAVVFDTTDTLNQAIAASVFGNLNVYTFYYVFKQNTTDTGYLWSESITPGFIALRKDTATRPRWSHQDDAANAVSMVAVAPSINDGVAHLAVVRRTALNAFSFWIDGVQRTTSTTAPGTTTTTRFTIGGLNNPPIQIVPHSLACLVISSANDYDTIAPLLDAHYSGGADWYVEP